MSLHIVLDSSPLSLLSSPVKAPEVIYINKWARECLLSGHHIYIPEIIDYELRRELIRAKKHNSIVRLDSLKMVFRYLPITTGSIQCAANLWAESRNSGLSTGDPKKLDIDVILAAQAQTLSVPQSDVVVATINVSHLSRFVTANLWNNIG